MRPESFAKHTTKTRKIMSDLYDFEMQMTSESDEWLEMPEFVQNDKKPFAQIIFRFATEQDLIDFANLIGQKLTAKTKSAWHPELMRGLNTGKRWVNGK